jgi:hypothetical protein
MSQENLEILRGLAQAAADCYDGALDENGERYDLGLKRDQGHPIFDSRTMDGFKIKLSGNHCIINYQSDIKLKEVSSGGFQDEMEQVLQDIADHLKKKYKSLTGNSINLIADGEANVVVQSTSRVRVFVNAQKKFKIGGLDGVEDLTEESEEKIESNFKSFLDSGGWGNDPENSNQKPSES